MCKDTYHAIDYIDGLSYRRSLEPHTRQIFNQLGDRDIAIRECVKV